jgi:hypothetical protein
MDFLGRTPQDISTMVLHAQEVLIPLSTSVGKINNLWRTLMEYGVLAIHTYDSIGSHI